MILRIKFVSRLFVTNSEQAFPRVLTGESRILPSVEAFPLNAPDVRNLHLCSFFVTNFSKIAKVASSAFHVHFAPYNFPALSDFCAMTFVRRFQ
jgi:hypothetical protein